MDEPRDAAKQMRETDHDRGQDGDVLEEPHGILGVVRPDAEPDTLWFRSLLQENGSTACETTASQRGD